MKFFTLLTSVLIITQSCLGYENQHMTIKPPKDWSENPKLFDSDIIFTSQIHPKKKLLSFYVKSYPWTGTQNGYEFIIKDLHKEYANNDLKIIRKNKLSKPKLTIFFIEASLTENGKPHNLFAAIAQDKKIYHYFFFQASEEDYRSNISNIKESIESVEFK